MRTAGRVIGDRDARRSAARRAGAKVTEIVQLALAANVLGADGQVFVCAKSLAFVPVTPMLVIVSGAVPELVSVTFCAVLVVPTR